MWRWPWWRASRVAAATTSRTCTTRASSTEGTIDEVASAVLRLGEENGLLVEERLASGRPVRTPRHPSAAHDRAHVQPVDVQGRRSAGKRARGAVRDDVVRRGDADGHGRRTFRHDQRTTGRPRGPVQSHAREPLRHPLLPRQPGGRLRRGVRPARGGALDDGAPRRRTGLRAAAGCAPVPCPLRPGGVRVSQGGRVCTGGASRPGGCWSIPRHGPGMAAAGRRGPGRR